MVLINLSYSNTTYNIPVLMYECLWHRIQVKYVRIQSAEKL